MRVCRDAHGNDERGTLDTGLWARDTGAVSARKASVLGAIVAAGVLAAVGSVLVVPGVATASVWITSSGQQPMLRADAKGDVGVGWVQAGARVNLVVPLHGQVYHAQLPGPDVSRPASVAGLAFTPTVRRTPGGWLVALQTWQVAGQPRALHVARWKGAPTKLTLAFDGTRLRGQASFQGKPVTGFSPTPAGKQARIYVYIDCFGCSASPHGWTSIAAVAPKADGSFAVYLRPSAHGSRYRAAIQGPNLGATLAPDAQAIAAGS
jgi:hypothetical protein